MQDNRMLMRVEAVSQSVGTETASTSARRGPTQEQEMVTALPHEGPADVTPEYAATGRGGIVVGAGEEPAHGEGPQESSCQSTIGNDRPAIAGWIWVPDLQRRFAQRATKEPGHRFGDLYDLLTRDSVLEEAAIRLLDNKGSRTPGLDGIGRDALSRNQEYHRALLRKQLIEGTFQPMPVRRVYIPKKNGKMRPLGIPTLYDRWVQMAIKLIIEPIFESDFANFSHGFRPKRSCLTATAHIHRLTTRRDRKVYWVIEGDIKGFFDHVHHKKLMSLLRQRINDKRLLDLIWQFLKAGVMEGELFKKTEEGTPQGGVLSPLLANIYLNHFDQWFAQRAMLGGGNATTHERERNRKGGGANFMMVRYADDFVIFSNGSKEATEAFKQEVKTWLAAELKLELSEEKTKITHYTDGFDFLGYTIRKVKAQASGEEVVTIYPSTASVERAVRRISDLTDRKTLMHSPEDQIDALNAFLRGWGEYFRHSAGKGALRYVGSRAFMRMWKWLVAKEEHQHGWREVKAKYYRDNTWKVGKHQLMVLQSMKIEYPTCKKIPNPYLQGQPVTEPRHYDPFLPEWKGAQGYGSNWTQAKEKAQDKAEGCVICGDEAVEVHHLTAKRRGGGNVQTNLLPLCRAHHSQAKQRNSEVSHQLREIVQKLDSGEPDAGKLARPVREEGL